MKVTSQRRSSTWRTPHLLASKHLTEIHLPVLETDPAAAAAVKSPFAQMLYRSKTERVLWPVISIATRSGIPARTKRRTAVRRRS